MLKTIPHRQVTNTGAVTPATIIRAQSMAKHAHLGSLGSYVSMAPLSSFSYSRLFNSKGMSSSFSGAPTRLANWFSITGSVQARRCSFKQSQTFLITGWDLGRLSQQCWIKDQCASVTHNCFSWGGRTPLKSSITTRGSFFRKWYGIRPESIRRKVYHTYQSKHTRWCTKWWC